MTTLIPIGRFSRLTRLSVKALRLYDELRLLVPAHVDATTGYRYYAREQTRRAVIISALRAVDMPLEEIRAFVETAGNAEGERWLLAHRARIAQRLAAHQEMLALIDIYTGNTPSLAPGEIELVEQPALQVAGVRVRTSRDRIAADVGACFARLARSLAVHALTTVGPPMLVYHELVDEQNDGDIEVAVAIDAWKPAPAGQADDGFRPGVLPACRLATLVHRGPFADVAAAHLRLFEWVAEHGVEVTGPAREVYLTDPATVAPPNLLTRIELPVASQA
jgi:effector-binding domain-containing protein